MRVYELPNNWRDMASGDPALLAYADEMEAHLKNTVPCYRSVGAEIGIEVIVPDAARMVLRQYIAIITSPAASILTRKTPRSSITSLSPASSGREDPFSFCGDPRVTETVYRYFSRPVPRRLLLSRFWKGVNLYASDSNQSHEETRRIEGREESIVQAVFEESHGYPSGFENKVH
jgi:hypothetical protein